MMEAETLPSLDSEPREPQTQYKGNLPNMRRKWIFRLVLLASQSWPPDASAPLGTQSFCSFCCRVIPFIRESVSL